MHPGMNAGFLTSVQFFLIRSESWAKVRIKSTKKKFVPRKWQKQRAGKDVIKVMIPGAHN
jgi:hypothetical protein